MGDYRMSDYLSTAEDRLLTLVSSMHPRDRVDLYDAISAMGTNHFADHLAGVLSVHIRRDEEMERMRDADAPDPA